MGCQNSKSHKSHKSQSNQVLKQIVEKEKEKQQVDQVKNNKKQSQNISDENQQDITNQSPPEEGPILNLKDSSNFQQFIDKGGYKNKLSSSKKKYQNNLNSNELEQNQKQLNNHALNLDTNYQNQSKNNDQNQNKNNNIENKEKAILNQNGNNQIPSYMFKQSREEANRLKMNSTQYTGYLKFLSHEKMEPSDQNAKKFIEKYQTTYGHTYQTNSMNNSHQKGTDKEQEEKIKIRKEKFMKRYEKLKNEEKLLDYNEICDNSEMKSKEIQEIIEKYSPSDEKKNREIITDRIALSGLKQIIIFKNMQQNMDENQLSEINRLKELYQQKKINFKEKLKELMQLDEDECEHKKHKQYQQLQQNERKIRNRNKTYVAGHKGGVGTVQFNGQFIKQIQQMQQQNFNFQNFLNKQQQNPPVQMNNSNPTKKASNQDVKNMTQQNNIMKKMTKFQNQIVYNEEEEKKYSRKNSFLAQNAQVLKQRQKKRNLTFQQDPIQNFSSFNKLKQQNKII